MGFGMNGQMEKFSLLCESASFPHSEELLKGIGSGELALENRSNFRVSSKQLLGIYDLRARHLRKRIDSAEISRPHARRLLSDTESFVLELAKAPDEAVDLWRVSADDFTEFVVFEAVTAKRVLGCLLTVSRAKVSESEWAVLWGEERKR